MAEVRVEPYVTIASAHALAHYEQLPGPGS
jgi:hypothetical protein